MGKQEYLLAITWNKLHDYGHTSRVVDCKDHFAAKGADLVATFKAGYRPSLNSTKREVLANKL